MSKYTTEVRYICESAAGLTESAEFNQVDSIIEKAAPIIFNFAWPIFDETYRLQLEKQILRHYYTREIGTETVGLWQLRLMDRLNLIMPKYNQLYESAKLVFNPLYDVDYTRHGSDETSTDSKGEFQNYQTDKANGKNENETNTDNTETVESSTKNMHSDTPQNGLESVESGEYLSDADVGNGESSTVGGSHTAETRTTENEIVRTGNGSNSDNEIRQNHYTEIIQGKQGGVSSSRLLMEYRQTFLNIDMMVVNELSDLFMGLW